MTDITEVFEQDVANGGAVDGELPARAVATLPVGVVTTRTVPALDATFGQMTFAVGSKPQRIGRDPRRRRLLLSVGSANAGAWVTIAESEQQAANGYGFQAFVGTPIVLDYCGELWFVGSGLTGADTIILGFLAELDLA